jgi:protein ImuB
MFACIYSPEIPADLSLPDFAYAFSPLVEETNAETVVIDVSGCELIFGSAYELANEIADRAKNPKEAGGIGCKVNVAVAGNPDAAIYAARFYEGISFITPGEEIVGLGELPIESLRFQLKSQMSNLRSENQNHRSQNQNQKSQPQLLEFGNWSLDTKLFEEILDTLRLWGVRTFSDFAALPSTGVSERLGQTGLKLQQLASGKTERHLQLKQPAPVFHNSLQLEHPVSELEPLSFIFSRLLNQLCAALNAYALATNELRIRLQLENQETHERILNLPHPMRDNKVFLKLLLLDTEMHPPASSVIAVSIACEPVKPRVLQNGLFIPLAPEPEKLELTLARLAKMLGAENVGSPELIDTHRPDAFLVKRFVLKTRQDKKKRRRRQASLQIENRPDLTAAIGFRVFRPPLKAMVEASRGYPTQISAWDKKISVHGRVVRLAGPWRTTGDWWRAQNWARDEWDVAVESGSAASSAQMLYRIYRDLRYDSWFVEGSYD